MRDLALPAGTAVGISGRVEEARAAQRRLLIASGVALVLVLWLLLGALGRWREVGVVVATLPVAFAGGLYALALAGETWNASSIVGTIGLFGVAVQNSLVLITQTRGLIAAGEAITQRAPACSHAVVIPISSSPQRIVERPTSQAERITTSGTCRSRSMS